MIGIGSNGFIGQQRVRNTSSRTAGQRSSLLSGMTDWPKKVEQLNGDGKPPDMLDDDSVLSKPPIANHYWQPPDANCQPPDVLFNEASFLGADDPSFGLSMPSHEAAALLLELPAHAVDIAAHSKA